MKALMIIPLLFATVAHAQTGAIHSVQGRVYQDANANGRMDRGESGLAEVLISNGREVVRSDAKGRYRIDAKFGDAVFVIKPRDHQLPYQSALPKFYRWIGRADTTHLKYAGGKALPIPKNPVDFALIPAPEPDHFEALVFGDPQPNHERDVRNFAKDIIEPLRDSAKQFAFGISLGDIVNDRLDLHDDIANATAALGLPWHWVAGNHDINFDVPDDRPSTSSYEAYFGPATYAYQVGRAHFVVLDDVVFVPKNGVPWYVGGLREDQFEFLRHYLATVPREDLLVINVHIPLTQSPTSTVETFRVADRTRLFEMLKPFQHPLILSAHSHVVWHRYFTEKEGWQGSAPLLEFNAGATCGGFWSGRLDQEGIPDATMSDGTPNGHMRLSVRGNQFHFEFDAARDERHDRHKLYAPNVVEQNTYPVARVSLNFYLGRLDKPPQIRIDGGEWIEMRKSNSPDPAQMAVVWAQDKSEVLQSGPRVSDPGPNVHLWNHILPTHLPVGEHRFEIRGEDLFGKPLNIESSYRIDPNRN